MLSRSRFRVKLDNHIACKPQECLETIQYLQLRFSYAFASFAKMCQTSFNITLHSISGLTRLVVGNSNRLPIGVHLQELNFTSLR